MTFRVGVLVYLAAASAAPQDVSQDACEVGKPARPAAVPPAVKALAVHLLGPHAREFFSHTVATKVTSPRFGEVTMVSARRDRVEWSLWCRDAYDAGRAAGDAVDIGANIGDTAIQLARSLRGRVLAVEPAPRTYLYLYWNLALNGVTILDEASFRAGRPGVLPLHAGATADGRNVSLAFNPAYSKNAQTVDEPRGPLTPRRQGGQGHKAHVIRTIALPAFLADLNAANRAETSLPRRR